MLTDREAFDEIKILAANTDKTIEDIGRLERWDALDLVEQFTKDKLAEPTDSSPFELDVEGLLHYIGSQPLKWRAVNELGISCLVDSPGIPVFGVVNILESEKPPMPEPLGLFVANGEIYLVELPKWRQLR